MQAQLRAASQAASTPSAHIHSSHMPTQPTQPHTRTGCQRRAPRRRRGCCAPGHALAVITHAAARRDGLRRRRDRSRARASAAHVRYRSHLVHSDSLLLPVAGVMCCFDELPDSSIPPAIGGTGCTRRTNVRPGVISQTNTASHHPQTAASCSCLAAAWAPTARAASRPCSTWRRSTWALPATSATL